MAITQVSNSLVKQDLTISGGTVDNTVIGSGTPAAGTFTTVAGTLASTVTGTTAAASDNSTKIATTAYVTTAIANLVDTAPSALNTLNELAAALGDDANFATTVTNSIATKAALAGATFTGTISQETATGGFLTLKRLDTTTTNNVDIGAINFEHTDSDDAGVPATILVSGDGAAGGAKMRFFTGTPSSKVERLTIDKDGSSTFTGSVQTTGSASKFVSNSSSSGDYIRLYAGSGTGKWDIYGNNANLRIGDNDSAGAVTIDTNVGIGTTIVDSKLHVFYTSSNSNPLAEANAGLNLEGNSSVRMLFGTDQASPFAGYIQASNTGSGFPLSLNPSGGNVGIGTTNPLQKIHSSNGFFTDSYIASFGSVPYSSARPGVALDYASDGARLISWGTASARGTYSFIQLENDGQNQQTALTIDASGNVGVGTTTLNKFFNMADPAQGGEEIKLHFEASSGGDLWNIYSYDRVNSHYTNMLLGQYTYIKSGGEVSIGNANGDFRVNQKLGVVGAGTRGGISVSSYINATTSAIFDFNKSRHATPGNHTVVQNNDALGVIIWRGDDGDEFVDGAAISANVDNTPGNGDMPARLEFFTSPDGIGGMREVMQIDSKANLLLGDSMAGMANGALGTKFTDTSGFQMGRPGVDNRSGILMMEQYAYQNTWITFLDVHNAGATGVTFLLNATRLADQNRHCTRLVRYAYNQTFTAISTSEQNTTIEYRVSGTSLQYRFTSAGTYAVSIIVMAGG